MFCSLGSVPDFNLSPQGDGNILLIDLFLITALFQLIPARGRKHIAFFETVDSAQQFQLIPARGRKPFPTAAVFSCPSFQLIPARGRKPSTFASMLIFHAFQLIPARGRKHPQLPIPTTEMFRFQLIPARGRKLFSLCAETLFFGFQLIPAKPSQALRASSPEGRAFPAATYLVLSSPFRGSWHGVSRD